MPSDAPMGHAQETPDAPDYADSDDAEADGASGSRQKARSKVREQTRRATQFA